MKNKKLSFRSWRVVALCLMCLFGVTQMWAAGTALADLNFSGITAAPSAYTYSTTNPPSYQASQGPSGDKRSCMLIGNGGKGQTPTIESTGPKTGEGKRWMAFCPAEDCDLEIVCTGNGKEFKLYDKNHYNAKTNVDATTSHVSKYTAGSKWSTWEIEGLQAGKWYVLSVTGSSSYVASMTFTATSSPSTDPVSSVSVSGATAGYATVPIELTATPNKTATAYKWYVDGVEQSGQTSATFNFVPAAPGTYSIVAKARNTYNATDEWIASSAHTVTISKLCGELIKIVQNGQSDGNVSGILTGTKDVKLSSGTSEYDSKTGRKIGSDNYWLGVTNLSAPLRAGDVASIFVTTTSANLILYSDKGVTKIGEKIGGVTQGKNDIELTSAATGKTAIYLYRVPTSTDEHGGGNMNPFVHSLSVNRSCSESDDCSMKSLTINGESVTPVGKVYSYEVAAASTLTEVEVAYSIHPLATATPATGFKVAVPAAGNPANTQAITVTAEDGTHSDTYTVSVTKATAASNVVTLDALGVTGYTLSPAFAAATTAYTITKAYGAEDPGTDKVTFTKTETEQTVDVAYDGTNHKLTVTVTAEDNTTTQDYVITINEAEAPKSLSRVLFSNGFDAFIDNTNHTVKAYYLAGTTVPTATTITAGAGTAGELAEGKITVTGADASHVDYTVTLEAVTPNTTTVAEAAEAGEFAGDEAWVKNGLLVYGNANGYSAGDKWYVIRRQLKSGDAADDQRVIAGWVRSYFFVGNASKFIMTVGSNKKLKYSVDGGEAVAVEPTTLEIALPDGGNHMIEIVSNQSSGDCRLSAPKLVEIPEPVDPTLTYSDGVYEIDGAALDLSTLITASESTGAITYSVKEANGTGATIDGVNFTATTAGTAVITASQAAVMGYNAITVDFNVVVSEPIIPVDPTLTYDDGAYTTGLAALDLSTLITASESTGAITYSVKEANGTGAAIDGVNFTATAAGMAVITASQAAVSGYNAITVDFNVVITEPTEVDGIKMVVNNALTGNFVSARTLSNGNNTVEGIAYTKYITMSSTMSNFGNEVAPSATKGIYYYPSHKNIRFYFYVNNVESAAKKIYIYTVDEDATGTSDATSANVSVDAGRHMVYADVELEKHAAVVFGFEKTNTQICQIVAVESGDALLQGGEVGYSIDYNKCYISPKANTVAVYDGIEYKLYADAKLVSASNVQLQTLGTHYIKFHLDAQMLVNVYADNKKYYIGSECSTGDNAKLYEATGNGEFTLAAGDWYINGSGAQVKINKLEFALPKAETPTITTQPATNYTFDPGDMTATVVATVTKGTLHYQWYKKATVGDDEEVGTDAATLTTTTEGTYYVVVTNTLAGHQDVSVTSEEAELGYRVTNDATLMALSYGGTAITLEDGVYNYNVELAKGTTNVPALAATATMNGYADVDINDAAEFVNYEASSTVTVKSEDLTETNVYTVNFYVKHDLPQVDVTASTVWDMTNVSANHIELTGADKNAHLLLANIDGVNNTTFNAQALMFEGQHIGRTGDGVKHLAGRLVQFNVTVPGAVFVTFESNGNNARTISINGQKCARTTSGTAAEDYITYALAVEPGSVEIVGYEGTSANQYVRISKIEFKAEADYTRSGVNPSRIGTLCLPKNAVLGGAKLYEMDGTDANGYLNFLEVENNVMVAGRPYVFVPENGRTEIVAYYTDDEDPVAAGSHRGMVGTFTALSTITDGMSSPLWNNYIISNNHFIYVDSETVSLQANRAYIVMGNVPAMGEEINTNNSNGAPRRRLSIGGENAPAVTTDIDTLNAGEQPIKMIIDGQLYILRGEKLFDATGRLVK